MRSMLSLVRCGAMVIGATVSALCAQHLVICIAIVALTVALMIGIYQLEENRK